MNIAESGIDIASNNASSYRQEAAYNTSKMSSLEFQKQEFETQKEKNDTEEQKNKLKELTQQLNKALSPLNTNITFNFSEDIDGLYITVSERDTNRLIRKIPSEEAMQLMAKMKEIVGIIFDKSV